MANNFDWQTEDDFDWDELNDSQETTPPKRRRWPYFLLIAALLGGLGYLAWQQVTQRIDDNTSAIRADIISSYNLLHFAASEQDSELFISLLSGRDSDWTNAQNDLFSDGLLVNRSPFNLHAGGADELDIADEETAVSFEFSPDLLSTEMTVQQDFMIEVGNGVTETVTLAQTGIFRMGRERWLYSPPDTDFWGEEMTQVGTMLTLTYPTRDAEIAEQLHDNLERKLQSACQLLGNDLCPSEILVALTFSTDPASLAATNEFPLVEQSKDSLTFVLPTPSLVGVPTDDASYDALFRGYGTQLVTAVYAHLLNFDRSHAPIYRAILDYHLDQLALKPWPVNADTYNRLLDEQIRLDNIIPLWRNQNWATNWEDAWPAYVIVDYLLATYPEVTALDMLGSLGNSSDPFRWLRTLYIDNINNSGSARTLINDLNRQLWIHAYQNKLLVDSTPPIAYPNQDLHLVCSRPTTDFAAVDYTLYRYDLDQESWQTNFSSNNSLLLNPLPNDEGVVIQEFGNQTGVLRTFIWQNELEKPLLAEPDRLSVSFGQFNPVGNLLTAFIFGSEDESSGIYVYDLDDCDENGCTTQLLPSIPIWSPSGTQSLFSGDPNSQINILQLNERTVLFDPPFFESGIDLFLSEKEALFQQEPVVEVKDLLPTGSGYAPFWLDEETIGFMQDGSTQETVLMWGLAGENNLQPLVTSADLLAALPADVDVMTLSMQYARPHPTNPQQLFITAINQPNQQSHLFLYDRESKEISWLLKAGSENHELGIAPNGRFLILSGRDINNSLSLNGNAGTLQFYDLEKSSSLPFPTIVTSFPPNLSFDWSADGEWGSLMLGSDLVGLYAPDHNYLKLIQVDFGNCHSPAWIN